MLLFKCVYRQIYYRVYSEYRSSSTSYQCSSALFLKFSGESI
nr:MAG TPA: Matrix protein 2 protein, proton channel, MEMBRANE [Caudoviricetes sp.]